MWLSTMRINVTSLVTVGNETVVRTVNCGSVEPSD